MALAVRGKRDRPGMRAHPVRPSMSRTASDGVSKNRESEPWGLRTLSVANVQGALTIACLEVSTTNVGSPFGVQIVGVPSILVLPKLSSSNATQ